MAHTPTQNRRFPSAAHNALDAQVARAQRLADEYERATHHYGQLVRHRLANPLSVIRGNAQTLMELDGLGEECRAALLTGILEMAQRLERISLGPTIETSEELCFDAVPRLVAV